MPDDHRHCKVCGKVCDPGEETCSKACRARRAAALQSRRNLTYLIYAIMAFLVIVLVIAYH